MHALRNLYLWLTVTLFNQRTFLLFYYCSGTFSSKLIQLQHKSQLSNPLNPVNWFHVLNDTIQKDTKHISLICIVCIFWGIIYCEYIYFCLWNSYQVILSCFCFHSFLDFYFNLTPEKITVNITELSTKGKLQNPSPGKEGSTGCRCHFRARTSHASVLLEALHFQPKTKWINTVMK